MLKIKTAVTALALMAVPALSQAQVWGTAADWSGTRSIGSGLVGGDPGYTSMTVSWSIAAEGDFLRYTYTFSNLSPVNGISHAILGLSANCTANSGCVISPTGGNAAITPEYGTFGEHQSNPGFPEGESIFGVKLNTPGTVSGGSGYMISFLSNRVAVWSDIYLKGASNLSAYNAGLTNPTSTNVMDFVAAPDTQLATVPEPATVGLMATGLVAVAAAARRRRMA